jgi:hypothetical protein
MYLAECVLCGLQGVGSTANFKSRLANYKSHIKHKRRTCSITNHFIDVHEADHSSLKFMLIDQHHSEVPKSENFWIGMLLTNRKALMVVMISPNNSNLIVYKYVLCKVRHSEEGCGMQPKI